MNAPRALPIVSGPVGLAETNSTFTPRGRIGRTRPHVVGRREDTADRLLERRVGQPEVDEARRAASAAAMGLLGGADL